MAFQLLPPMLLVAIWAALLTLDQAVIELVIAEDGLVETLTAVLFGWSACLAFLGAIRGRNSACCRCWLLLIAGGSLFVALEEISYGQRLFGWKSPEFFARFNHQGETNLHNLFDNHLSHWLRTGANLGFPLLAFVLPLAGRGLKARGRADGWATIIFPGWELIAAVATAEIASTIGKLHRLSGTEASLALASGELKEFFWSLAMLFYVTVLCQRTWNGTKGKPAAPSASSGNLAIEVGT